MRNLLITLFLVCLTLTLYSQEQKKLIDLSLEELLNVEVVTASKKSQKISDAPATVLSFSAEQIKRYGWRDLKDLFRALPGFDLSYDNQGEVRTLVNVRGIIGNQKITILQDGEKYNPTTGERFIFANNIPLNFYKRVEIVYGPASALYGPDAYSGVINLITKDGEDIDGVETSIGYLSTQAIDASFLFGKKLVDENIDFSLGIRRIYGQDYKLHEDYEDYAIVKSYKDKNLKLEYPINNWNLFFKLKYKDFVFGGDWQKELESNAPGTIPANYAYAKGYVWGQDIRHLYAKYSKELLPVLDLNLSLNYGDYEINPASNFLLFQDNIQNVTSPSYKYGFSRYIKGQLQLDWQMFQNTSVITGVFYEDVLSFPKTKNLDNGPFRLDGPLEDKMYDPPFSFIDPSGHVFGVQTLKDSVFGERNYYNLGLFVQAQSELFSDLVLTLGGRLDYNSIYKETFNPRVGLVYKPFQGFSTKLLFGTAYIQPSNYYRWENFANPFILHIPNQDIKPERITNISLSTIYYPTSNFYVRFDLFRNDLKDMINAVIVDSTFNGGKLFYNPYRQILGLTPYVNWAEINANLGEIYTQGFEIEFNYKLSNFVFNLSYTYTTGKDKNEKDDNVKLAKISPHKINFNTDFSYGNFKAGLTLRYYSDVWTLRSNSLYGDAGTKTYKFEGAFVAYLNLAYHLTENLEANLSIENLLNTKHYGAAPYGESGWVLGRVPQALRKIFFGLHFTL